MQGYITRYFKKHGSPKGYGFIFGDDNETYYFSARDLMNPVEIGDSVVFEGGKNEKGNRATKVRSSCNSDNDFDC